MVYVYSDRNVTTDGAINVISEYCYKEETDDVGLALSNQGYNRILQIGTDLAAIELFILAKRGKEDVDKFGAIALVALGDHIETYVMPTFHDALDFMKEYSPAVGNIIDVAAKSES